MELSELQKQIVESKEDKIVVIARAAVGKTRCLTERVRFWLKKGVDPSEICCITFTNLAANEMQMRLGEDYKDGMFIGTIHSLAAQMLASHGYGAKVGNAINNEDFDLFFNYIREAPSCIVHYSYVLVDEAQDLSSNEYHFIFNMIKPEHFFVVGDPFQCIYEGLKNASAKYMSSLLERPDVYKYDLNENYRNKANILNYAQKALKPLRLRDNSIAMSVGGTIFEGKFDSNKLIEWLTTYGEYRDWAILCYTNRDIEYIMDLLDNNDIPNVNFNQKQKTKKEIDELIELNRVKVLTIWGAKGLGFPNVVVFGKNWMATHRNPVYRTESSRVNYVAYTRAMDALMICK